MVTVFDIPPRELIVRSVTIYVAMVVALRLFGKREIGQFTLFDLVLVFLVANAVQPAMTGADSSLGGGLLIILTLVLTNRALAEARRRLPFLRVVLESRRPRSPVTARGCSKPCSGRTWMPRIRNPRCVSTVSRRSTRSPWQCWSRMAASASFRAVIGANRHALAAGYGS